MVQSIYTHKRTWLFLGAHTQGIDDQLCLNTAKRKSRLFWRVSASRENIVRLGLEFWPAGFRHLDCGDTAWH